MTDLVELWNNYIDSQSCYKCYTCKCKFFNDEYHSIITWECTVELLYCGHLGDYYIVSCIARCPHFRGKEESTFGT